MRPTRLARVLDLAEHQHCVVTAKQALALGLTRDAISQHVARGRWSRALAGTYVVDPSLGTRWDAWPFATRLTAARLCHGPAAIVTGPTAGELLGIPGLPPAGTTIHLALPPGRERHQQPGVRLHTVQLAPADVAELHFEESPVLTTTLPRTVADLARCHDRWATVSLFDALVNNRRMSPVELEAVAQTVRGRRGAVHVRRCLQEYDGRSESPLETRIRLIAADAGLLPDELQLDLHDECGAFLARADLAWRLAGDRLLVAEADGAAWHESPEALYRDRRRANGITSTGRVDVVRFAWPDTFRPAYVVGVLRAHLGRRS